jgi:hypothetical protein
VDFTERKTWAKQYVDRKYEQVLKELGERPESLYQLVFDDEEATINHYIKWEFRDTSLIEIKKELQSRLGFAEGERVSAEFANTVPHYSIPRYRYTPSSQAKGADSQQTNSGTSRSSGTSNSSKMSHDQEKALPYAATAVGGIVGGLSGIALKRTVGGFVTGAIIGGIAGLAVLVFLNQNRETRSSTSSTVSVLPNSRHAGQSEQRISSPDIEGIIKKRKVFVEQQILGFISDLEHRYKNLMSNLPQGGSQR